MSLHPTSIVFHGTRRGGHTQVRVFDARYPHAKPLHDLPLRLDVVNHSPSGFEWGYAGSGPAQLALAMLLELGIDAERAALWHQEIKFALVVTLDHDEWRLSGNEVMHALETAERRDPHKAERLMPWR